MIIDVLHLLHGLTLQLLHFGPKSHVYWPAVFQLMSCSSFFIRAKSEKIEGVIFKYENMIINRLHLSHRLALKLLHFGPKSHVWWWVVFQLKDSQSTIHS